MKTPGELTPEALRRSCDPEQFDFVTTAELGNDAEIVGQPRAVEAVRFAVGIDHDGYNVFALGPSGMGKHFLAEHFLTQQAEKRPIPHDLCYVHNFAAANKPSRLMLPAGMARQLSEDMDTLVEEISSVLPVAFESDEYQARLHSIEEEFKQRPEQAFDDIQQHAKTHGFALLHTPVGMIFAPVKDGEVVTPEAFKKLPEEEQKRLQGDIEQLQERLQKILREIPRWEREMRSKIRELNRETTDFSVGHLIDELREKYAGHAEVLDYLLEVQKDIIDNARDFLRTKDGQAAGEGSSIKRRYQINVLVDHGASTAAPVVYEDNPSFANLIGRIEHIAQMGTLVTDFMLIKPGALHRANGGYLLLDARKVLLQPYAWEGLKRALRALQIRIESLGQALSLISTVSLEPEAVPLDVKVVLLGDRLLYYLLCAYDPEFSELFKVAADFHDDIERSSEHHLLYARLLATLIRKEKLRAFDKAAVARVIEQSSRLVGDGEKLSARIADLADLLREADYWAGQSANGVVTAADVQTAIDAQTYRADRIRERIQQEILCDTIYIDTAGTKVGQVNGLSVLQLGNFSFGRPSRITARVRLGEGEVIDIEREVELGGPLHAKGVFILSGFLGARYARAQPLSLAASLVFEQSYGGIEGDSASSAELYALLSAIAELPLRQSLAVTGSVNQHGEVQPIGGVNEKIEGFFDLCKARGLSGEQGVIIPKANVKHLMLRQDVVEAARADRFHVYPVDSIDQGMEILSGLPAGELNEAGDYPEGSVNFLVTQRLKELSAARAAFAAAAQPQQQE